MQLLWQEDAALKTQGLLVYTALLKWLSHLSSTPSNSSIN